MRPGTGRNIQIGIGSNFWPARGAPRYFRFSFNFGCVQNHIQILGS